METLYYILRHGEWHFGMSSRLRCGFVHTYYDCEIYILHLGPVWVEVDA